MKKLIIIQIFMFIILSTLASAIDLSSLILEYRFENNTNDNLNINNLSIVGILDNVTGYVGSAKSNNASDSNFATINSTNITDCTEALSINAFIYRNNNTNRDVILYKGFDTNISYLLEVGTGSKALFRLYNGSGTSPIVESNVTINNGSWYMLTGTWNKSTDSGKLKLYVNGLLNITDLNVNMTNNLRVSPIHNLTLFHNPTSAGRAVNGVVDELTVWCRDLSSTEVLNMYNNYTAGIRLNDATSSLDSPIINTNEENMDLNSSIITSNYTVNLTLSGKVDFWQNWFYFNISNISNRMMNFTVTNPESGTAMLSTNGDPIKPVYSCNGVDWDYVNGSTNTSTKFYFWLNTSCNSVKIALLYPYSYSYMMSFVNSYDNGIVSDIVYDNTTQNGSRVVMLKITNSTSLIPEINRKRVLIISALHGNSESFGIPNSIGMIKFLTNLSDSTARTIRDNYVYYIVPMANPDSFRYGISKSNGLNQDLNDHWNTTTVKEINELRNYINILNQTKQFDFYVDYHTQGGTSSGTHINRYNVALLGAEKYAISNAIYNNISAISRYTGGGESGAIARDNSRAYMWYNLSVISHNPEPTPQENDWSIPILEGIGMNYTKAIYYVLGNATYLPVTYYVSNSGDDSNDGLTDSTPIQTITKLNTITLNPGDTVRFKKGDTWRLHDDAYVYIGSSGNSSGNITYSNYGTGALPRFLGSYNASNSDNWTCSGNICNTTFTMPYDVGNLIFNVTDDLYSGVGAGNKSDTYAGLNTLNEFYYNPTTDKLSLYSPGGNPATININVEIAVRKSTADTDAFDVKNQSYIVIDGLDVRYDGQGGICKSGETPIRSNLYFINNKVSWMGGVFQTGTLRYGNCMGFSMNVTNSKMINNTVYQCYDAGIAPQAWATGGYAVLHNQEYINNTVTHANLPFEFFVSRTNPSSVHNISITHNTFGFAGYEWAHQYRSPSGTLTSKTAILKRTPSGTSNITFKDNILYLSYDGAVLNVGDGSSSNWDGAEMPKLDYNLYYSNESYVYLIDYNNTDYVNLSTFKTAISNNETNGIEADPLFIPGTYQPQYVSLACGSASDGGDIGALACGEEDITNPNLTIISPLNETYNASSVLLNLSYADNVEVDSVWYSFNGSNYTYSGVVNITIANTTYIIQAYVNDTSGNINNSNVTFTSNYTAPPEPTPGVCAVDNTTRVFYSLLILAVAAGLFAALSAMGALNIGTIIVLFTGTLLFIIVLAQYIGLVC
jgi:hypothetical protein